MKITEVDRRIARNAALANEKAHDELRRDEYARGAPHIKHASLRRLFEALLDRALTNTIALAPVPRALDLGAGDGAGTFPLLHRGAHVTAVDVSGAQLQALKARVPAGSRGIEIRQQGASEALDAFRAEGRQFEIVLANSFLHHVPDYLALLRQVTEVVAPGGIFLSFQDPLRYDTLGRVDAFLSRAAYLSWRLRQGDVIGGTRRFLRRCRGVYLEDSHFDNTEYHVVREGVDQNAIRREFVGLGLSCEIVRYFSTSGRCWQALGASVGAENSFAVVARKSPQAGERTPGAPTRGASRPAPTPPRLSV